MSLQKEATKRVLVVLEPSDSVPAPPSSTTIELAKVFQQETSTELDCISSQRIELHAWEAEKIKLDA